MYPTLGNIRRFLMAVLLLWALWLFCFFFSFTHLEAQQQHETEALARPSLKILVLPDVKVTQPPAGTQMGPAQITEIQTALGSHPSRPDNVVGAFPDRSRVSTPPAGTQMGHEQMAAIRDALGPNGNLLVWGLGNDSPFWNDATTGRVAFLEDDIPEAKAGTLWYDVITRKYPFLEAYKVHYHTDTVESFQQYIDSPDRWHELRLNDLPDSIRGENWDVIVVDAPL